MIVSAYKIPEFQVSGYSYMYCLVSEVQHNIMEKTNFFHDCEIKSGSGLGIRLLCHTVQRVRGRM